MSLKFYSILSRNGRTFEENANSVQSARISNQTQDSTALSGVADAFEELSAVLTDKGFDYDFDLKIFCNACSLVSALFGSLGKGFKFAELEYCSKVNTLIGASEICETLNKVIDLDVQTNTVKTQGSLSRCLRRVRQGLDLIRALFQNFLSPEYPGLREAASTAYATTCAPYHTWAVRTAVSAGMYALPTREQLLLRLNETNESAEKEMTRYINSSLPIIQYVDRLYTSRGIILDW